MNMTYVHGAPAYLRDEEQLKNNEHDICPRCPPPEHRTFRAQPVMSTEKRD
ncbi:MAG: hypothetical protein H5T35_07805 [Methanothermobacter sp.]|nr:hypothetical protein [Methanothermobacter sp.]